MFTTPSFVWNASRRAVIVRTLVTVTVRTLALLGRTIDTFFMVAMFPRTSFVVFVHFCWIYAPHCPTLRIEAFARRMSAATTEK